MERVGSSIKRNWKWALLVVGIVVVYQFVTAENVCPVCGCKPSYSTAVNGKTTFSDTNQHSWIK